MGDGPQFPGDAVATCVALDTEVRFVRGVGPVRAKEFAGLGVRTVGDLIEYFPFRHEPRPKSQPIGSLELGRVATVVGELQRVRTKGSFTRQVVSGEVVDGTGRARVRWFNSPFLVDKLHRGQVGTVVEQLSPGVFEVEFTDNDGRAFASLALKTNQLMVLHYQPLEAA